LVRNPVGVNQRVKSLQVLILVFYASDKIIEEKYPELLYLNPVVIAHSDDYQTLFNSRGICFGVQLEIARLISSERIQWEQISIPAVKDLEGENRAAAPLVEERLLFREMSATYKENFADELTAKVRLV
jgi:hypothetical protein